MRASSTFAVLVILSYGMVNYNPALYWSPRLGSVRVVNGALYTLLVASGVKFLGSLPGEPKKRRIVKKKVVKSP